MQQIQASNIMTLLLLLLPLLLVGVLLQSGPCMQDTR